MTTCPACCAKGRQISTTRDGVKRYTGGNLHGCRRCRSGWSGAVGEPGVPDGNMGEAPMLTVRAQAVSVSIVFRGGGDCCDIPMVTHGSDEIRLGGEPAHTGNIRMHKTPKEWQDATGTPPPTDGVYHYYKDGMPWIVSGDGAHHPLSEPSTGAHSHEDQARRMVERECCANDCDTTTDNDRVLGPDAEGWACVLCRCSTDHPDIGGGVCIGEEGHDGPHWNMVHGKRNEWPQQPTKPELGDLLVGLDDCGYTELPW